MESVPGLQSSLFFSHLRTESNPRINVFSYKNENTVIKFNLVCASIGEDFLNLVRGPRCSCVPLDLNVTCDTKCDPNTF